MKFRFLGRRSEFLKIKNNYFKKNSHSAENPENHRCIDGGHESSFQNQLMYLKRFIHKYKKKI